MIKTAAYWIEKLGLQPHPEGGWFRETYRSDESFSKEHLSELYSGDRNFSTQIYYLLEHNDQSFFHRLKSDEFWHFYTGGSAAEIILLSEHGMKRLLVGSDPEKGESYQVLIPKNTWFAAHLCNKSSYALVGCTVSPGFDFDDFEMGSRSDLLKDFPEHEKVILELTPD
jgi:predicted cupin superfamily sugar epimerase